MRALAEFIMRGRVQAALVAFFGNLLPLVSPAAVSLVTLNKGLSEGALLTLWALLPLLIAFFVSDINAMVTLSSIVGVIGVMAASELLRVSASWARTLIFVVVFSGVAALVLDFCLLSKQKYLNWLLLIYFEKFSNNKKMPLYRGATFYWVL
ncbi:MAG: hypothetical protein MUQ57_04050 [Porticoccus sp.]|nr:hypothetical protein [Porticoccus sp.]